MNQPSFDYRAPNLIDQIIYIEIGTRLSLWINTSSDPLLSNTFIGMDIGHYVLVKPDQEIQNKIIKQGDTIIGTYLCRKQLLAFKTAVMAFLNQPVQLLILKFPDILQLVDFRQAKRTLCYFKAEMKIGEVRSECSVIDVSIKGCRCQISKNRNQHPILIQMDDYVLIEFKEEKLNCHGIVRNIEMKNYTYIIGVEFTHELHELSYLYPLIDKCEKEKCSVILDMSMHNKYW
ncbi:MAG: flagellar brake domain-containing protein [Desulfobacterales bacterium]|nr:flagellar brake domain-containing protein [Desulfobacterales bacterium]